MPKGVRRGSHESHVHRKHNTTTNQCVCKRFITTTAHWNAVMMIKFVINSNCAQPDMNAYKRVRKRLHHHWHLVCRKVYILHILHHSNVHHKHKWSSSMQSTLDSRRPLYYKHSEFYWNVKQNLYGCPHVCEHEQRRPELLWLLDVNDAFYS